VPRVPRVWGGVAGLSQDRVIRVTKGGMVSGTLSLSLAGLTPKEGVAMEPRAAIEWAAGLGYRAVQLDGAAAGVRARDLDRSGRRDLAALLRRLQLGFSGLDLWIPPAHFVDAANTGRAVDATVQAMELVADLARLIGSDGAVVSVLLAEKTPEAVIEALSAAADRVGARVADHQWPARSVESGGLVGVGIDPAALLASGADPAAEVSRLSAAPTAARLSDLGPGGRVAVGSGKLDVLAYQVALATKGYSRAGVARARGRSHGGRYGR
jgi:sugar phosphate isomerase/epimerase